MERGLADAIKQATGESEEVRKSRSVLSCLDDHRSVTVIDIDLFHALIENDKADLPDLGKSFLFNKPKNQTVVTYELNPEPKLGQVEKKRYLTS